MTANIIDGKAIAKQVRTNVAQRVATTGRNPRTGEKINIQASKQPKFKAGKELKEAVNK